MKIVDKTVLVNENFQPVLVITMELPLQLVGGHQTTNQKFMSDFIQAFKDFENSQELVKEKNNEINKTSFRQVDDLENEIQRLRAENEEQSFFIAKGEKRELALQAENARLREALQDIFDYECRTSSTSLIACTARDALWPRAALEQSEPKP